MRRLIAALLFFAVPVIAQQYNPNYNAQINAAYGFQELGKTSWLAASTTTANIVLSTTTNQIQVFNTTTAIAYVVFCASSTCVASAGTSGTSTSDYPVAPGSVIVKSVPAGITYAAAILSTGTGAVLFTPGVGL